MKRDEEIKKINIKIEKLNEILEIAKKKYEEKKAEKSSEEN